MVGVSIGAQVEHYVGQLTGNGLKRMANGVSAAIIAVIYRRGPKSNMSDGNQFALKQEANNDDTLPNDLHEYAKWLLADPRTLKV